MKFVIVMLALLSLPVMLNAGVNLKNGNFFISYTDIVVPGGGNDLEITRTYNSKAPEKGWFGLGWGSEFETFLMVSADGSVTVHENGSGARTRFIPSTPINPEAASKTIVEAMRKRSSLSDNVAQDLIKKLTADADLRDAYARKFDVKSNLADGTVLYSNVRGVQKIFKEKEGYRRSYNEGKDEFFGEDGKLIRISDKNGYKLEFTYKDKYLESIKDSDAKQLFFSWYPDGKVKSIWSTGDKKTLYVYKGDDLIESTDVSGNFYKYSYDNNHNMTKVAYTDNTSMDITYDSKTQFVANIKSRNGEVTAYQYDSNPKNPRFHYWTNVVKKVPGGKDEVNRYEYEIKSRPDGSQYTYRIKTDIGGLVTETIYSECCSLPLKIARGNQVTTFEYNDKGLLTKKTSTKGDYVEIKYDDKIDKITRVVNENGWTNFEYDKKANLAKAVNSEGKSVLLIYDRNGRITKMVDHNTKTNQKRTLSFQYNALGKPVEITMDDVGVINVAYDNYGQIKKVDSKSGHQMALQVTQAFQSLLSIVKPAGVNLNM